MRHFAIGDIHGCYKALTTLAACVPFDRDDVVITLGDYVNRGPNSRAVLDWLLAYQRTGKLIALRGNHEIMMMQARYDPAAFAEFLRCGGDTTLASYANGGERAHLSDVLQTHWHLLEQTRGWFETDTHLFVHANAYADYPLEEQPDFMLYWESFGEPAPHASGKIMVCGHTAQRSGRPKNVGHAICIDTWAYGDGWLTCLDVESSQYWQANQRGETRVCLLDVPD